MKFRLKAGAAVLAGSVAAPPLPTRTVNINVDEGTWMSVDVSPIAGSAATRIAEGLPFEMQPQFSPDGRRIAARKHRVGAPYYWE